MGGGRVGIVAAATALVDKGSGGCPASSHWCLLRCACCECCAGLSTSLSVEETHKTSEVKGTIRWAAAQPQYIWQCVSSAAQHSATPEVSKPCVCQARAPVLTTSLLRPLCLLCLLCSYMSPELFMHDDVSPALDVYSFGIIRECCFRFRTTVCSTHYCCCAADASLQAAKAAGGCALAAAGCQLPAGRCLTHTPALSPSVDIVAAAASRCCSAHDVHREGSLPRPDARHDHPFQGGRVDARVGLQEVAIVPAPPAPAGVHSTSEPASHAPPALPACLPAHPPACPPACRSAPASTQSRRGFHCTQGAPPTSKTSSGTAPTTTAAAGQQVHTPARFCHLLLAPS